jgi:phage shock protein E
MTLQKLIKNPAARFVDVRSVQEFNSGHYPGAVNIPLQEIQQHTDELKKLNVPIVLYCRSGARSYNALQILKQLGFSDVHNAGGLQDLMMIKNLN